MNKKNIKDKNNNKKFQEKFNQVSSLFIGRWQPFHAGHKAMIETVLKKQKSVVIAIRDTIISEKNPYTVFERWSMIQNELNKYNHLVKIIIVPDIDEICYGRDQGYEIRRIDLPKSIENISGTKIRQKSNSCHKILWLTGQSGSGKTTLANALKNKTGGIILDGDEMRQSISTDLGFSYLDREEHNIRVAKLAKILSKDNFIIVSVISPFENIRKKINTIINPVWIYVEKKFEIIKSKPFEPPKNYHVKVNFDLQSTEKQVDIIINFLKKFN